MLTTMLPQGCNTQWVSRVPPSLVDKGNALRSPGQVQNPHLLVLDEATSALDTERQVCLNLAQAFRDRTVFSLPTTGND